MHPQPVVAQAAGGVPGQPTGPLQPGNQTPAEPKGKKKKSRKRVRLNVHIL